MEGQCELGPWITPTEPRYQNSSNLAFLSGQLLVSFVWKATSLPTFFQLRVLPYKEIIARACDRAQRKTLKNLEMAKINNYLVFHMVLRPIPDVWGIDIDTSAKKFNSSALICLDMYLGFSL